MALKIVKAPPELQKDLRERDLVRLALEEIQAYLEQKFPDFKPKHKLKKE